MICIESDCCFICRNRPLLARDQNGQERAQVQCDHWETDQTLWWSNDWSLQANFWYFCTGNILSCARFTPPPPLIVQDRTQKLYWRSALSNKITQSSSLLRVEEKSFMSRSKVFWWAFWVELGVFMGWELLFQLKRKMSWCSLYMAWSNLTDLLLFPFVPPPPPQLSGCI